MRRFAFALALVTLAANAGYCVADDTASADQKIAQAIVETLREHQEAGRLKGFDIDLNVDGGRVVLTGNVANEEQHRLAIDAARFAPGVKVVVNDLKIKGQTHEHPGQQRRLGAGLAALFQREQPAAADTPSQEQVTAQAGWEHAAAQTAAGQGASPAAPQSQPEQTTGEQIDQIANPNPLSGGASRFTQAAAARATAAAPATTAAPAQIAPQMPVATVNEIKAQPDFVDSGDTSSENIVAGPADAHAQLARWAPSQQAAQAPAGGQTNTQPAANASLQAQQQAPRQAAPAQPFQAQPLQAQTSPAQQVQAVQMIPVPVPVYPQMAQRQRQMPLAYAASRLPGNRLASGEQVRLAQAMQAQQLQPAPQFIQGTGSGAAPVRYDHPNMPGYAWPSYASYPNYAALQYPKQYSAHAWPYIGPFYPYPQVPLGWRKVTLTWDDGWWFLDFKDRGYGPYVTR